MKPLYLLPAILLAGCATDNVGSVSGECKLVHTSTYQVLGKTKYDQGWIDDQTEAMVRGCKQPRPKARPAALDTPANAVTVKKVTVHWWQKIKP